MKMERAAIHLLLSVVFISAGMDAFAGTPARGDDTAIAQLVADAAVHGDPGVTAAAKDYKNRRPGGTGTPNRTGCPKRHTSLAATSGRNRFRGTVTSDTTN